MEYLIEIAGAILLGVGTWALTWLSEKWKLDGLAPEFEDLLGKAVQYGERKAKQMVPDDPDFDNQVLDLAVDFVLDTAPQLLKQLDIDADVVEKYVEAKMEQLLGNQ
jgi:hypothetical protein